MAHEPKVKISILNDYDMRHYEFSRRSGLPLGYFRRPHLSADAFVVYLSIIGFLFALWIC